MNVASGSVTAHASGRVPKVASPHQPSARKRAVSAGNTAPNPLPVIAYNDSSLTTLQSMLAPLLPDTATADIVNGLLPRLPGLDLNLNVGFNGAQAKIAVPDLNLKLK